MSHFWKRKEQLVNTGEKNQNNSIMYKIEERIFMFLQVRIINWFWMEINRCLYFYTTCITLIVQMFILE